MAKLSKKDIEELREFLSRGCEYAGTQEIVNDLAHDALTEIGGSNMRYPDEVGLVNDEEFAVLDVFVNVFWDKAVEKILNVVETQGR